MTTRNKLTASSTFPLSEEYSGDFLSCKNTTYFCFNLMEIRISLSGSKL